MQAAKVLLVPFLLAIFFALITIRPMLWLQAHKVPSALAAILVVVALMLFLTGTNLSIMAAMGIIMMTGLVVAYGILLVDFADN